MLTPVMDSPAVEVSEAGETAASLPSLLFEVRLRPKFGDIADTQIRDWHQRRRDAQRRLQLIEIEDADPSDAKRFGPRREPQILNRADCRVDIHSRICLAA